MKTTPEILEIVDNTITTTLSDLTNQVVDLRDSVDKRFLKIYQEELWEENKFGPIVTDQFKNLKSFMFHHFASVHNKHDVHEKLVTKNFETQTEKSRSIQYIMMEEMYP
jgi:hypothetical protein